MIYFKRAAHGSQNWPKGPKELSPVPRGGLQVIELCIRPKGPKELSPVPRMRGWERGFKMPVGLKGRHS